MQAKPLSAVGHNRGNATVQKIDCLDWSAPSLQHLAHRKIYGIKVRLEEREIALNKTGKYEIFWKSGLRCHEFSRVGARALCISLPAAPCWIAADEGPYA